MGLALIPKRHREEHDVVSTQRERAIVAPSRVPQGSGRGQEPEGPGGSPASSAGRQPAEFCLASRAFAQSASTLAGRSPTAGLEANSLTGHRGDQVNVLEAMLTLQVRLTQRREGLPGLGPVSWFLTFPGALPHPGHPTPTVPPVALPAVRPLSSPAPAHPRPSPGPGPAPVTPPVGPAQQGASPSRPPSSGVLF